MKTTIEITGQHSRDYGTTYRVVESDERSNILRSQGGLTEAEAAQVAAEWEADVVTVDLSQQLWEDAGSSYSASSYVTGSDVLIVDPVAYRLYGDSVAMFEAWHVWSSRHNCWTYIGRDYSRLNLTTYFARGETRYDATLKHLD